MKVKSQTSMILLVIVVIMFIGVVVVLLSLARSISKTEYMNLYAHNTWLALSRADTGYSGADCKLVADVVGCAFLKPEWRCDGYSCFELAEETLTDYLNLMEQSSNNRFFLNIEPYIMEGGELKPWVVRSQSGRILKFEIGDESLEEERVQKWVANEIIPKGQYILKVELTVAKK